MGFFRRRRDPLEPTLMDSISAGMQKGGKAYRWLFNISLFALFVPVAVLVVGAVRQYLTSSLVLWMSIVAIIGFSCIVALYWVRFLEANEHKIVSIVFLSLTILNAVIWIASAIVIVNLYRNLRDGNANFDYPNALNFIKVVLVITLQIVTANFIARMIIKYKKTYIGVQVIAYASHAYIDLWLTLLLWCIGIKATDFSFNWNLFNLIIGPTMMTLFVLALIYSVLVNSIIKSTDRRKIIRMADKFDEMDEENITPETFKKPTEKTAETEQKTKQSVEEKLAKLKDLFDKNLITEEEYNTKRNDILSDM